MKGWFLKCSLKEITTSSPVQLKGRRTSQGKEGNNLERWLEPETPEGIALDSEAVLTGRGGVWRLFNDGADRERNAMIRLEFDFFGPWPPKQITCSM